MEYTPSPQLEKLKSEKEKNEKKIEQLEHKIQRLLNRQKYYEDGDRKKRTHHLCTLAGTLESIAPQIKDLAILEATELLEHIFHMDEVKNAVNGGGFLLPEVLSSCRKCKEKFGVSSQSGPGNMLYYPQPNFSRKEPPL